MLVCQEVQSLQSAHVKYFKRDDAFELNIPGSYIGVQYCIVVYEKNGKYNFKVCIGDTNTICINSSLQGKS